MAHVAARYMTGGALGQSDNGTANPHDIFLPNRIAVPNFHSMKGRGALTLSVSRRGLCTYERAPMITRKETMAYTMTPEQTHDAAVVNWELAMRSLARAAALEDERWGMTRVPDNGKYTTELDALHNSGALWMQARAICNELGRDWDAVADGARRYAQQVLSGAINVTN